MEYGALVGFYDRLDATTSTNETTDILANALSKAGTLLPEGSLLFQDRLFAPWETTRRGPTSPAEPTPPGETVPSSEGMTPRDSVGT